ncbi:hypothetical protein MTP99_001921 [Tenebrio molitor]|nr:hypothetical protein MTP99_001921 [Tenebrio molitor]
MTRMTKIENGAGLNLLSAIVPSVTTGPLERSYCRVHLRGRCRDFLTDAVLTPGRFTRTVRPFVQKGRSTEKNNLLLLDQVEKWPVAVPFPAGVDYF